MVGIGLQVGAVGRRQPAARRSAGAAAAAERAHVMEALGLDEADRDGVVRISMGWSSETSDTDGLAAALERVLDRVRVRR